VLGSDNGGEAALTYTWAATGPASASFSANGANASKNTTATFTAPGTYTFAVILTDAGGLTNTSSIHLNVVWLQGDVDTDGQRSVTDIGAMMVPLSDLNSYQSSKNFSDAHLLAICDLNSDNQTTSTDLQGLIVLLANSAAGGGGGSASGPAVVSLTGSDSALASLDTSSSVPIDNLVVRGVSALPMEAALGIAPANPPATPIAALLPNETPEPSSSRQSALAILDQRYWPSPMYNRHLGHQRPSADQDAVDEVLANWSFAK